MKGGVGIAACNAYQRQLEVHSVVHRILEQRQVCTSRSGEFHGVSVRVCSLTAQPRWSINSQSQRTWGPVQLPESPLAPGMGIFYTQSMYVYPEEKQLASKTFERTSRLVLSPQKLFNIDYRRFSFTRRVSEISLEKKKKKKFIPISSYGREMFIYFYLSHRMRLGIFLSFFIW